MAILHTRRLPLRVSAEPPLRHIDGAVDTNMQRDILIRDARVTALLLVIGTRGMNAFRRTSTLWRRHDEKVIAHRTFRL
ncbi:MAG: hypothetical protein ACR2OZ_03245 [Verrucomicrobiales bacterium]